MDRLIDSPCTMFCVLAAKSCYLQTTQIRCSSPGNSSGRLAAVFVLRPNVLNVFALIPQFTNLRSNKECTFYNSIFNAGWLWAPRGRLVAVRALGEEVLVLAAGGEASAAVVGKALRGEGLL